MNTKNLIVLFLFIAGICFGFGTTRYVNLNNAFPNPPYTSWADAARTIQDAVDVGEFGDTILINDGTYTLTNEISVNYTLIIKSVNGPNATIVDGNDSNRCFNITAPISIYGLTITNGYTTFNGAGIYCSDNSTIVSNCIFDSNHADINGGGLYKGKAVDCTFNENIANSYGGGTYSSIATNCTFNKNSATQDGGAAYSGTVYNCYFSYNIAYGYGGGMYDGTAYNSIFFRNEADYGGGMSKGAANNCSFTLNKAYKDAGGMHNGTANGCNFTQNLAKYHGGGAQYTTASDCSFSFNTAYLAGGGMSWGTASNCLFDSNFATNGGGTINATAINCMFDNNSADNGGGMQYGTAVNSIFHDNIGGYGGALYDAKAINCTIANNQATTTGGGAYSGSLTNCIIWYNTGTSGDNLSGNPDVSYSCSPEVANGVNGNITANPMFVYSPTNDFRIHTTSPCINAGINSAVTTTNDYAGNQRILTTIVDMGAYEGGTPTPRYVKISNSTPTPPYTTWQHAATNIQDAINAAYKTDTIFISNGVYHINSTIMVTNKLTVIGVNGPDETIIDGGGTTICMEIGPLPATITGLSISNGYSAGIGAGIYCQNVPMIILSNCTFIANTATNSSFPYGSGSGLFRGEAIDCKFINNNAYQGGGMYNGIARNCKFYNNKALLGGAYSLGDAYNCEFRNNSAAGSGGGMYGGTATDSTFTNNSAISGAGAYLIDATNCLFIDNVARDYGGGLYSSTAVNSDFIENESTNYGGGIADSTVTGCYFRSNNALQGGGAYNSSLNNCSLLYNNASLEGGGMHQGSAFASSFYMNNAKYGGGVYYGYATNSIFLKNTANFGGGIYHEKAANCLFRENSAGYGGGAYDTTLINCTLKGNYAATNAGGAYGGIAYNSILWYNESNGGSSNFNNVTMYYSCTPNTSAGFDGNITNHPLFIDKDNNNLHLRRSSPCINAGSNALASGSTDLDGFQRIANGIVDMGAYEYSDDQDGDYIKDSWEVLHFGSITNCAPGDNPDNDGMSNLEEYIAGTDPTNSSSFFHITNVVTSATGIGIEWTPSVSNRFYSVSWGEQITNNPTTISNNMVYPQNSYTDTIHHTNQKGFYNVKVQINE